MVVVMNRDTPQAVLVDLERLGVPDLPAVRAAQSGCFIGPSVIAAVLAEAGESSPAAPHS